MEFTEWMNIHKPTDSVRLTERLEMRSGLSVSVQASSAHYCYPREDLPSYSDYFEFEMGFPSEELPSEFTHYAEDRERLKETVYGYVPKGLIEDLVRDNGGVKEERSI